MRTLKFLASALAFISLSAFAQESSSTCKNGEIYIPLSFEFADSDVQQRWIYDSLRPRLIIDKDEVFARSSDAADGKLTAVFCVAKRNLLGKMTLRVGPRSYDLVPREVTTSDTEPSKMAPIYLVKQPRPDWVIVKSFERVESKRTGLPVFDLELFNFGKEHPGGEVQALFSEDGWSCAVGSPPLTVIVEADIVGQKLKLSSTDPEYPEEQISREATLKTGICRANFMLKASFGPTGRLPPGPIRIRYSIRSAAGTLTGLATSIRPGSQLSQPGAAEKIDAVHYFFSAPSFRVSVEGEGIWSK